LKKFGATRRSRTGDLLITNPAGTVASTEHHHNIPSISTARYFYSSLLAAVIGHSARTKDGQFTEPHAGGSSVFRADTQSDVPKKLLENSCGFSAVSVICPSLSTMEERDDDSRKSRGGACALPVVRPHPLYTMR